MFLFISIGFRKPITFFTRYSFGVIFPFSRRNWAIFMQIVNILYTGEANHVKACISTLKRTKDFDAWIFNYVHEMPRPCHSNHIVIGKINECSCVTLLIIVLQKLR